MTKNLMIILILTLSLSHCSSMDILNVGGGIAVGWMSGDKTPRIIEKLKKRVQELEADREILKKDIDRLSEYSRNLETMMRSKK